MDNKTIDVPTKRFRFNHTVQETLLSPLQIRTHYGSYDTTDDEPRFIFPHLMSGGQVAELTPDGGYRIVLQVSAQPKVEANENTSDSPSSAEEDTSADESASQQNRIESENIFNTSWEDKATSIKV